MHFAFPVPSPREGQGSGCWARGLLASVVEAPLIHGAGKWGALGG